MIELKRFEDNPIIDPEEHEWESKATFNAGTIFAGGKVHILYRAMNGKNTSVLGYASSKDGLHIDERMEEPVYVPREDFEKKSQEGNSGCEDPRLTRIGNKIYMCYTAFDAKNPTRVALTSIKVKDMVNKKWNWEKPVLISPPGIDDKNACVLPKKFDGKYAVFHRIHPCIWVDFVDSLEFDGSSWVKGDMCFQPRTDKWDSEKIGIAGPPMETKDGWVLIYHGVDKRDKSYKLGAMLLDLDDPTKAISRLDYPLIEPKEWYENEGLRAGTIFSCGSVVIKGKLFVYYGGADKYIGVATVDIDELVKELKDKAF